MRIAVVGAGGVGGYFGGRLAQHGEDVTFIARGAHLQAMRAAGLRVSSQLGDFVINPVSVTDRASTVGPVDVVMFAVKLWDVESAASQILPLVGSDTAVISFQNGVDAEHILAARVGAEHVAGGLAYITTLLAEPGRVEQVGSAARLVFGELDGRTSARLTAFADACRAAGIDVTLSTEIEKELWSKFVYLCALSGLTTLTRHSLGPILQDADTRALFVACMSEVAAVARARGVNLDDDIVARQTAWGDGLPPTVKSSMLVDLERGNPLEVAWLSGAVARMGAELGVNTPVNAFIHSALKLHADGSR